MRRMFSKTQLEAIVQGLIPEILYTHVYSLSKSSGNSTTGSLTTVYFVSDKNIENASALVATDIHNKVIGVNYNEWDSSDVETLWVSLGSFETKSSGQVNFYRIKQVENESNELVFDGITDTNISLSTLKSYTLTKLI